MATFDEIAAQMAAEQRAPSPLGTAAPAPLAAPELEVAPLVQPPPTLDDIAGEMKAERDQEERRLAQLMRFRAANDTTPPEQRAKVLKYAAATGLPPDLVAADFDRVRREVDAAGVDWAQLRRDNPGLRQYLDDRPEGHPLAQEDLEQLSLIEWALKAPPAKMGRAASTFGRQLKRWFLDAAIDTLPSPDLASDWQNSLRQKLSRWSFENTSAEVGTQLAEQDAGTYGATSLPGRMLVGTAGALPEMLGEVGLFAATGGAGTFALGAAQTLDSMEARTKALRNQYGELIDPEAADTAAHVAALFGGALNIVPLGKVLGVAGKAVPVVPGSKALLDKIAGDAVERALKTQGFAPLLQRAAAEWGIHTVEAGTVMGLLAAVEQTAEEGVKGTSGLGADPGKVATAFADGFVQGVTDMALLGAYGSGRQLLQESRRLAESRVALKRYAQMVQAAADSKMLERSPAEFEVAAEGMAAQPGAVAEVAVPVEAWTRYWQGKKVDPAQVADALLGDGGKAYSEALATKGDLAIPSARFLARLGKTEHMLGLAEDVRLGADALTPREAKEVVKAREVRLKEEAKVRGDELEAGKREVEAFIREQAVAAGIAKEDAAANAKLVAEYAGTMALRLGVSVQEAANLGALGQLSIRGPKNAEVAAAARERFAQYLAPSASRLLADRLGTMSPEARAREFYVDPVTGLRNRRAFDAAPRPEGAHVAVLTLADIKAINDSPDGGHDVANELLRVAGAAVGGDAARSGTNFLLYVKDQAELDAVLARVKAALPDQRLTVEGALGATPQEAGKALDTRVDTRRAAGELPPRGTAPTGLDIGRLAFSEGRAAATVPPELVAELGDLTPEEYFRRAYQDEKSPGILSREGWEAIPRKAYVASIDLRGLKDLNTKLGKAAGDEVLRQFGEIAQHFGGSSFDFAHLSGDEYAAQSNDPAQLEAWLERLQREAHTYIQITATVADGSTVVFDSKGFRYGIARGSYGAADRALNEAKRREQGGAPGELGGSAGRAGGPVDLDRRDGDLAEGRGALGRGATPQGFPGAGEAVLRQEAVEDASFDVEALEAEGTVAHVEGAPVRYGPDGLREARAAISRMREGNREAAQAFLSYAIGETDRRPAITPELERSLARYGVVDPKGFSFDEAGREMARPIGGKKKLSEEPASLREYRMRRQGTYKAYGDADAPLERKLYQPDPSGDEGRGRGSISFKVTPEGRPVEFRIEAFRGDRSTLAHETAHFLSWSLHEIATSDIASPDVRADYDALLKWAGYESPEQRVREQDAAKEEKFSHAWEQYLAEGKAPSRALARVFTRFAGWMLRIYRGLAGIGAQYEAQHGQQLELSDEVRGIFDRLLAADESLTRAREEAAIPARPDPNVEAAMTPEERESYRRALVEARTEAEAEVAQRAAELQGPELRAARARITVEVAADLDVRPEFAVQRFLQRGELPDGKGGALAELPDTHKGEDGQPIRLNRKLVADTYGADAVRALPRRTLAPGKQGVSADELAPLFGYETGAEMLAAVIKAGPREKAIEDRVQQRMDATYGPALERLQAAALAAIHSDAQARVTLLELRKLAKEVDPATARRVQSINLETLKSAAERMVAETPVGSLNPDKYLRAERQTALRAERLWGQGKRQEALDEKEARLLNLVLYRAARDTQERLEKARERLEGTTDEQRAAMGRGDPAYRDVHDTLLQAVDLGPGPEDPGRALGLDAMLRRAAEDAQELDFDVDAIRELLARPRTWDSLTVQQAQNVVDAATNIRTAARAKRELTLAGKTQTKDTWFAELQARLGRRTPQDPVAADRAAEGLREKVGHLGRGADAMLTDVPETLSHMLDAGDRQGPAHRLLVDGRLEARDRAVGLTKRVLKPIRDAWAKVPKELQKLRDEKVPELAEMLPVAERFADRVAPVYTRSSLWMLYLNWGNEGNRQRIRDGNGWSDEQVQRALSLLKPEELAFLEQVARTVDGLFPEIAAAYERRTGLQLKKVEGSDFEVNGQKFAGHYFPLRYDSRIARQGEVQAGDVVAALFQPNYVRPTTRAGHTKGRLEKVPAPVELSWGVVPAHLEQVVQDLSYGDWVRQAGGILLDERFKALATQYLGAERVREFVPWLRDVANARADSAAGVMSDFQRSLGAFARNRLAVSVLGANIPNMLQNLTDPWGAVWEGVGRLRIATAYLKVMNPANWGRMEFGLSKELAFRESALTDNMRRELARIGPTGGGVAYHVAEVSFRVYDWLDKFSTRVAWKAAFDQEVSQGATQEAAAARADDVVRRNFASHDIAEKPPILRTRSGLGAVLVFYSWANRRWNQLRRAGDDVARGTSSPADFAAKLITMAAVGVAGAFLAGRGPKQDEDPFEWAALRALLEPLNTIPWVGGIAEAVARGDQVDARTAPELAFVTDTVNRLAKMAKEAEGDKAAAEKLWLALEGMLALAGAPAGQIQRTAGYVRRLASGEAQPRGPLDVASGLIYGEKREPVETPLTAAQTLISGQ